jgi:hypothetical protein
MAPSANGSAKDFYEDDKNLMKLCDFLRSGDGPAVREAIEMDKRVYYIKGALGSEILVPWSCFRHLKLNSNCAFILDLSSLIV